MEMGYSLLHKVTLPEVTAGPLAACQPFYSCKNPGRQTYLLLFSYLFLIYETKDALKVNLIIVAHKHKGACYVNQKHQDTIGNCQRSVLSLGVNIIST